MTEWRYGETILHIDLTSKTAQAEPTALALKRSFVGGAGFVARLLAGTGQPRVAMAAGPLSDGMAGRLSLGAAPGPGSRPALSSMGGTMAAALKGAGFDAIVIDGELDEPGCLLIGQDEVRLVPAGEMWGMTVPAAQAALSDSFGPGHATMVIGPAGEHRVAFATLAHDGHFAGGSGVGYALGSARLKAILIQADQPLPSRCTGCTLACPGKSDPAAAVAGDLGLDAPTAARLAAIVDQCAAAGLLPLSGEPLKEMAYRTGIGQWLADGEAAALARLGPEAQLIAAAHPRPKKRGGPGAADLVGICQRIWRDRPGELLRSALSNTVSLLAAPA